VILIIATIGLGIQRIRRVPKSEPPVPPVPLGVLQRV